MLDGKKGTWKIILTLIDVVIAIIVIIAVVSIIIVCWGGLATSESKAKASIVHMQEAYDRLGKATPVEILKTPIPVLGAEDIMCENFEVYLSKGYQISSDGKEVAVYNLTKNGTRDTALKKMRVDKSVCCPGDMDKELKCCPQTAKKDDKKVCVEKQYCSNDLVIGGERRITGKFCMCSTPSSSHIIIYPKGYGTCLRAFT